MNTKIEYWDERLTRYEMAAICAVNLSAVNRWKTTDSIPKHAITLLQLYTGELSQGEWEDYVQERAEEIGKWARAETAKSKRKAK